MTMRHARPNINQDEAIISLVSGGFLTVFGLSRRSPIGVLVAAAGAALAYRGATKHCAVYESLDIDTTEHHTSPTVGAVTIQKSAEECYQVWRDLAGAPRFMTFVDHVEVLDEKRSRWTVAGPRDSHLRWEAEIVEDRPNEYLQWQSVHGSPVHVEGWVRFAPAPGDRGTRVTAGVALGSAGDGIINRLARPFARHKIQEDLRRFRELLEAGEVPSVEGQPSGREAVYPTPYDANSTDQTLEDSFPASDPPAWTGSSIG